MKLEIRTSCTLTLRMEGDTVKVEIAEKRPGFQSHGIWRGVRRQLHRVLRYVGYLTDEHTDSNRNHQCNACLEIHTDYPVFSFRGYTTSRASKGPESGSTTFEESQDPLMSGLEPSKL